MEGTFLKVILLLLLFKEHYAFVRLEKSICTSFDANFSHFDLCEVKPDKQNLRAFSMNLRLLQKPLKKFWINAGFYRVAQKTEMLIINRTWDACDFLGNRRRYPAIQNCISRFEKFTNLNHSCPISHDIFVKEYSPSKLTIPVPQGKFILKVAFLTEGKSRLSMDLYLNVG